MKAYGPSDRRLKKGVDKRKRKAWIEFEKGLIVSEPSANSVSLKSNSSKSRARDITGSISSQEDLPTPMMLLLLWTNTQNVSEWSRSGSENDSRSTEP